MKLTVTLAVLLLAIVAMANVAILPPINSQTLIGTGEALTQQNPATLWHMDIRSGDGSYLCQFTVGTSCVIRHLISSECNNGTVKLHFGDGSTKELPNEKFPDLWIVGPGEAEGPRGTIDWKPANIHFIKGTWTRDVAEASKVAEETIREQLSAR